MTKLLPLLLLLIITLTTHLTHAGRHSPLLDASTQIDDPYKFLESKPTYNSGQYDLHAKRFFQQFPEEMEYQPTVWRIPSLKRKVVYIKTDRDKIYRIGKFIANGANGVVNIGYDLTSGEKVVIKRATDDTGYHSLRNEMKQTRLHSPEMYRGKALIRDEYEITRRAYAVFKFVNGTDLWRFLLGREFNSLSDEEMSHWMMSLMESLSNNFRKTIWEKGFEHRDLRPANIMLKNVREWSEDVKEDDLQVIDFGSALYSHGTRLATDQKINDLALFFHDFLVFIYEYDDALGSRNSRRIRSFSNYSNFVNVIKHNIAEWVQIFLKDIKKESNDVKVTIKQLMNLLAKFTRGMLKTDHSMLGGDRFTDLLAYEKYLFPY